jgi:endonuclease III
MTSVKKSSPPKTKAPRSVFEVAAALKSRYHDFDHYNLDDPLDELMFIVCSTKTTEPSYLASYQALKSVFPSGQCLLDATEPEIAATIASGGLSNTKAKAIKAILGIVATRFGAPTLEVLHQMSDAEIERFLTTLPTVGRKVARCVMMYSLGRNVFPVDTHCWRIARRLGWIRPTQKGGHCSPRDMDRLQSKIPAELRFSLHVNFVSLGREICNARKPKCDICPIAAWCKKIGVLRTKQK